PQRRTSAHRQFDQSAAPGMGAQRGHSPLAETARPPVNVWRSTLFVEKAANVYHEVEGHCRAGGFKWGRRIGLLPPAILGTISGSARAACRILRRALRSRD